MSAEGNCVEVRKTLRYLSLKYVFLLAMRTLF